MNRACPQFEDFTSGLPNWLPNSALNYLRHIEAGVPIRELARGQGCHPSTVLRQVRRMERRRDEFLIDDVLTDLGQELGFGGVQERQQMNADTKMNAGVPSEAEVEREARRVLRRLVETGAVMAVARDMEKAVIVREMPDGRTIRTGVVDRSIAQAMALKDWVACKTEGRLSRYRITQAGRAAMQRLLASDPEAHHQGFAEAPAQFGDQHRTWGEKDVAEPGAAPRRVRYNVAESPITVLARRKDANGEPFLSDALVNAGERLREDFEMAQMGPRVAQDWDRFLTGGDRGAFNGSAASMGPEGARERVNAALRDLGPGLGDVVLRCCCFLEGLETAEKRMGWSARSGKIVLRIALQRLHRHYEENGGERLIG